MGVIERVAASIAGGATRLDPLSVRTDALRRLHLESPWAPDSSVQRVIDAVTGLGPIQQVFDDPELTDILVNGPAEIWVDRGRGLERTDLAFGSDEELVSTIERVIAPLGLRLDRSSPMIDARLADGSRLHATLPPAAVDFPLVAIRRFTQRISSLDELVDVGTASRSQIDELKEAVAGGQTIVVSGGTAAGKTTLLNLLGAVIPKEHRVVTIEDAAELNLPGHVVRLEARPPNAEGAGEITIRSLLKSALRLRPDRIIVGEVRGPEALDLISALNTGHHGSLTTVHANSPQEALWRLETLAMMAGTTSQTAVVRQLRAAVDLVVQIERHGPERRLRSIFPVESEGSA